MEWMRLEKIAKNVGYKLYKRYHFVLNYDIKDFEQECRLLLYKIPSHKYDNKYLYKSCYNNIVDKVRKLENLSNNNKEDDFDFDSTPIDSAFNTEQWMIIKDYLTKLSKEESEMLHHYLKTGEILGNTSNKYIKFNKLKEKIKNEISEI
jgi:hypothetical protein